jgi:gluconolactonase
MRKRDLVRLVACVALAWVPVTIAQAPPAAPLPQMAPFLVPAHAVDLMTPEGSALFGAQWKGMEGKIVEGAAIANAMPGYKTSYDIQPHAGERGFDDSSWPIIGAKGLADRRGGGRVSFLWYRANLTIPAKLGDFDTAGATAVLTVYVDDYAEIWVNGQIARRTGYPSPATIQGFNIPNRVVLADPVKPGDKFEIAVFGINGPISMAPMNFVFFREAKLEFFR